MKYTGFKLIRNKNYYISNEYCIKKDGYITSSNIIDSHGNFKSAYEIDINSLITGTIKVTNGDYIINVEHKDGTDEFNVYIGKITMDKYNKQFQIDLIYSETISNGLYDNIRCPKYKNTLRNKLKDNKNITNNICNSISSIVYKVFFEQFDVILNKK